VIPQFGVDLERYTPHVDQGPWNGPFRIGFAGRLVPQKGPQVLMRAAARLPGDWQLLFIGSGPMEKDLKTLAEELQIGARVQFEPWVASAEMPPMYQRIDVLVLPSSTLPSWKEQFGRVLIEAMASAIPVIGSDCGEIPTIIGDTGLVFHENDIDGLVSHLQRLQCDPPLRAQLGNRAWERVLRYYTQDHIADETFQVYCEMAKNSSV
jgi:glycosyltransferase involved in cell wall biosynthesis